MKGIILAGGTGSRLFPLTRVTNKHLLPVGPKPMIMHCVEKLTDAGIKEIMIITGPEHMGAIVNLLGSGKDFACHFTYRVQDEAGGIAQALGLCEAFVGQDHCCVILGDNIFTASLKPYAERFKSVNAGAMLLLKRVPDPGRYGVAELSADKKKVVGIEEKPKQPKTDYAVTGMYFYDASVFRVIKTLKPSGRGELEITDVNNHYVALNALQWDELPGEWTDAGTFPSLLKANEIMAHLFK
ncbi:MAG TPA: sugar phosphate nucleotidyltransferase [Planctomycetota bacterium]|nr:sugar phosphate nucleotidyltransferase [Planctomycetota bacterium]